PRSASSPFSSAGAAGPSVFERAGRRQTAPLETTGSATAAFAPVARKRKRRKRSEFADPSAERRTLWFALLFLPLLLMLLTNRDNLEERIQKAIGEDPIAIIGDDPDGADRPLDLVKKRIAALPEGRIPGALLSVQSYWQWPMAMASVGLFCIVIPLLAPARGVTYAQMLGVGLFTGAVGIGLLLTIHAAAEFASTISVPAIGFIGLLVKVFVWLLTFLYWSMLLASDPTVGFFPRLFGHVFGVGLPEEFVKLLPLLIYVRRATKELDWRSLRTWGVCSGAGFGIAEGISYSANLYNGIMPGDVYLIRFISCVAFHGVLTGCAALMLYNNAGAFEDVEVYDLVMNFLLIAGISMSLHGLYNALSGCGNVAGDVGAFAVTLAGVGWFMWLSRRTAESG
ncbi:MAG TPA: PrsW family glutamic-type intramembrane protease, partial [Planctomycetia bacterium]|nr:PrsW family glutamic-type intramembrane protease [Planctomycetia bacterium]